MEERHNLQEGRGVGYLEQWRTARFEDVTTTPLAKDFRCRVEQAVVVVALQVQGEAQFQSPIALSNITQATQAQVTATAHGRSVGHLVRFQDVGGMIEINGLSAHITVVTANTFDVSLDTTDMTAYASGGAIRQQYTSAQYAKRGQYAAIILSSQADGIGGFTAGSTVHLDAIALAVTSNPAIDATLPTVDGDIEFQLGAVWDDLAQVTGKDLAGQ